MDDLSKLVLYWNKKAAELLNFHSNPGHDSRRFAVVQIAIHDTLNSYLKKYNQYSPYTEESSNGQYADGSISLLPPRSLPKKYWNSSVYQAVNRAAYKVLIWATNDINEAVGKGFPGPENYKLENDLQKIEGWYNHAKQKLLKEKDDAIADQVGEYWANAITIYNRDNDNIDKVRLVSKFPDGTDDGKFRYDYNHSPPPNGYKFVVNYSVEISESGDKEEIVKPFVLTKHDQFRRPLDYSEEEGASMIDEVESMGKKTKVDMLPKDEKDIIDYWSHPKHYQHILWNTFAREIIFSYDKPDAWAVARVFALIHTAMADGAIAMFGDLYHFYHWRPATAIHDKYNRTINKDYDPQVNTNDTWGPYKAYNQTPRVPEYPASFGVLGGATGAILRSIVGGDTIDVLMNKIINPATNTLTGIHYSSISKAVNDNAYTKINCGWNFRKSIDESLALGTDIGNYVLHHKFQPISGIEVPEYERPFIIERTWVKIESLISKLWRKQINMDYR
ncbi:MAG: hypothetical protein DHS20C17_20100 [Cyclobacteriaceae bacterium]|nr:MAG: hypothetical protein DHS20C17_20100 [Cyclobacteriaceae bacterium]